jgi:nucleotide-binding universal stress UspA family protein
VPNILAPVRPDRDTDWAVGFLIKLHQRERIRVHLLSVQPPLNGHVRMFFNQDQLSAFHQEDAEKELEPMRRALDAAGVPYNMHVVVGYLAEEIAKFAQEHHCPQIVMGPMKGSGLSELILGSLTRQVEHLMRISGKTCEVL